MSYIERVGYGSAFNDLIVSDGVIIKRAKNATGEMRMAHETAFYKYIADHSITFPVPAVLSYGKHEYTMTYLADYVPLYTVFPTLPHDESATLLLRIENALDFMHASTREPVDRALWDACIREECYTKLFDRIKAMAPLLAAHEHITHVNGRPLRSFEAVVSDLYDRIVKHTSDMLPYFSLIHGDCQFNNVLYNVRQRAFVFIDPRAYFGKSALFGLAEYDHAKVRFALSGYDVFDNMTVDSLRVKDGHVTLDDLRLVRDCLPVGELESLLVATIWLGNAHMFKHTPAKAMYSYYYAHWIAEQVLGTYATESKDEIR